MIRTRWVWITTPKQMKRGMLKAIKRGKQEALDWWHEKRLPRRFKRGSRQKYGYAKRTEKYNRAKRRRKGHAQPLVWSGQMRDALTKRIDFGGSARQFHGKMFAPRYMHIITQPTKSAGGPINKVEEILTVVDRETRMMSEIVAKRIEKDMNE